MSAVIKTVTPFVIEEVLISALEKIGAEPVKVTQTNISNFNHSGGIKINDIITNRSDYYGVQHFRFEHNYWILRHDSSEMRGRINFTSMASNHYKPVIKFLNELSNEYDITYQKYLERLAEEDRARLEAERKERLEIIRKQTIEKAKAQGYSVKETRNSQNQIQLILTRLA